MAKQFRWIVLALLTCAMLEPGPAGATPSEDALARINRLPPAERQAALVKEAKNEKSVVWYAPMNREDLRQFTGAFEAEYPFLKVEILTGGPAEPAQPYLDRASRRAPQLRHSQYPQLRALYTQKGQRRWALRFAPPARPASRVLR